MKKIMAIEVRENYRVWLRFGDGAEGEVDLSVHVGKGVFAPWADYGFFRKATVGQRVRTLTWPGELDLCADALRLQVTGKKPDDLFPTLRLRSGTLVISRVRKRRYTLGALRARVRRANLHSEAVWREPTGREVW